MATSKAIGLMSGGLDSLLATRLLVEQGVEVLCVCFTSPFFGARRAQVAAQAVGVPLEVIDFAERHLVLVKDPPHGYGRNMNPCIDCHALMLHLAGDLMTERGYDFLFTGEVLGERPMSQNRNALQQVAKLSGYPSRILRPLSAKVLDETPMEKAGLVDRSRLAGISGRSRKPQMELATRLGILSYEPPAGGCLLTDPTYSGRLRELLRRRPAASTREARLLTMGRVLWPGPRSLVVSGRRHAENERLQVEAGPADALLHVAGDAPGSQVLLAGDFGQEELAVAARLAVRFSDSPRQGLVAVNVRRGSVVEQILAEAATEEELERLRETPAVASRPGKQGPTAPGAD